MRKEISPMAALETAAMRIENSSDKYPDIDYRKLTNEELHMLARIKIPHVVFLSVTNEIRETVIAMLEVSE